jgi:uncharacterized protein (TIGR03437 family)
MLLFAAAACAQAPSGLAVKVATNKKVDLAWSGTSASYTVQRRVLGGAYSNLATVTTGTTYSDSAIDAYTTYQYQVVANLASGASSPSNQITAGPPPAGFNVVAPAPGPAGSDIAGYYGYDMVMTLDGNGDPALAWIFEDPNVDGDYSDTQVLFRSWNRATYNWNAIAKVAVIGDAASTFHNSLAIAFDAGTNTFGIFSEVNQGSAVRLYFSTDGGATWSQKADFTAGTGVGGPTLALRGGNVYLAYTEDYTGIKYYTGQQSATSTTWLSKIAPIPTGTERAPYGVTASLALDSAGNPGIAYFVDDDVVSYNRIVMYWRPAGSAAPTRVMDSQGRQSDEVAVRMVYHDLNPRIVTYVQRADGDFGVGVHFIKSDNGGANWNPVVVIPPDGNSSTDFPFDLAVDSQDHGAIGYGQNGGSGDSRCASPKLSVSTNGALTNWTTCGIPGAENAGQFSSFPGAIALAYGGNDKLLYAWWDDDASTPGIYLYREPPAGASNAPSISSVVNGATFQAGIVAGSWVTITGANLSDVSRTWNDSDFTHGDILPNALSGVSVKINGLSAAVYYVSPTQINVQAPAGINGSVSVVVTKNGASSPPATASAVSSAPGLFTYSLGGKNYPSALYNGTYVIVGDPALYGSAAKAKAGDIIQLYGTGLGTSPAGNIISSPIAFSGAVTATIGTANASVLGTALVAVGEYQINIQVPSGLADGDYPLLIKANGTSSQTGIIIPIGVR